MPKSSSERNKEYRRRLRAKAKAWDRLAKVLPPDMRIEMVDIDQGLLIVNTAREAREIAEQANG